MLALFIAGAISLGSKMPKERECIKYQKEYYWSSWGAIHFVGTDLDRARVLAGGEPLDEMEISCLEYSPLTP